MGLQWSRNPLRSFDFAMTLEHPHHTAVSASDPQGTREKSANLPQHSHHETRIIDSRTSKDQVMSSPVSPASSSQGIPRVSLPDTPSARTGPPRSLSLSFTFSHPNSPTTGIPPQILVNGQPENEDILENDLGGCGKSYFQLKPPRSSSFRGAFELSPSLGQAAPDKKGKTKESRFFDRFHDSPTEERPEMFPGHSDAIAEEGKQEKETRKSMFRNQTMEPTRKPTDPPPGDLQSSQSHPLQGIKRTGASARWNKLRGLLPSVIRSVPPGGPASHSVVTSHEVNITDELIAGGLSMLMLGLWFERDEKGHRRMPVLLHRLRIRISDSLHPLQAHKAVFRIECEYANGAARWVVYRELRDFMSLHAHFAFSNTFSSQKDVLPEFPRTSKNCLPLLMFRSVNVLLYSPSLL